MILLFFFFILIGCQGSDLPSDPALKKKNQKGEYIYRTHDQITEIPKIEPQVQAPYSWERGKSGSIAKISKEYFRCKGSSLNAVRSEIVRGEMVKYFDCGGSQKHSLPLKDGKEWVYPIFLDLLNYIQTKTNKRVVITSGHRCPEHNTYVDSSPYNQTSKHQIGAEVDFYVQGMEKKPEDIIKLILDYYKTAPIYQGKKDYIEFKRYDKEDVDVSTKPWMNKEIFIKLYKPKEGRNFDNRHPYPYISIQVRFDAQKQEKVVYSWDQAFRNYMRY